MTARFVLKEKKKTYYLKVNWAQNLKNHITVYNKVAKYINCYNGEIIDEAYLFQYVAKPGLDASSRNWIKPI